MNRDVYDEFADVCTSEARRLHHRLRHSVEFDELLGIATEGMLRAAKRLETDRTSNERRAYIRYRVRGFLFDSVGDAFNLPRRVWRRLKEGKLDPAWRVGDLGEIDRDFCAKHPHDFHCSRVISSLDAWRACRELERLPARSAELLFRVYFEGRSLVDAARLMGLSPSWASRLRAQAFKSLRARLLARTVDRVEFSVVSSHCG